ncbi:type VI secretion system accessory protein TagJ [Saccharophagus degradans]|uniref:Type VI secretion system accessory protein TagJ n=1 Tax=Saccharophagus degradans TaxID=86304 RepID=A0AAW7X592_9GAMM|nr:type VI secretion system accessory protein TagJ [Saccharophagus degradans]MDO6421796.1 type VI secretion system accessory protein TagJ [Saccharophagus degradans]MDO6606510.1 type VI secretion system accessory protein TagJ [Saccharophagus degradans]
MATASEEYSAGNIQAALTAIAEEIKASPSDAKKRAFFVELLCIAGEYERADQQLNTLVVLDPQSAITVGTWRQLIRAAQSRMDVYQKNAVPDVIDQPTPVIARSLELLVALNADDATQAAAALEQLEKVAKPLCLNVNGKAVEHWRDLDDVNAYVLELLGTNGKYFWIDYAQIESIEFDQPARPLDMLWRKVTITLNNGSVGEAFVPAVYPYKAEDDAAKLGRLTQWHEQCGLSRGEGLRTWLLGDEALTVFEVNNITASNTDQNSNETSIASEAVN